MLRGGHLVRTLPIAALLVGLSFAATARADFVVIGSAPAVPSSRPAPLVSAQPPDAAAATETAPARPAAPHFFMAYGFGDNIPLAFAARQIVPKAVKVTYGPGADPGALVTWKGGAPWNRVLLAAVHRLGLRLVMTHMAVEIRK
jgi:hypothetical protein